MKKSNRNRNRNRISRPPSVTSVRDAGSTNEPGDSSRVSIIINAMFAATTTACVSLTSSLVARRRRQRSNPTTTTTTTTQCRQDDYYDCDRTATMCSSSTSSTSSTRVTMRRRNGGGDGVLLRRGFRRRCERMTTGRVSASEGGRRRECELSRGGALSNGKTHQQKDGGGSGGKSRMKKVIVKSSSSSAASSATAPVDAPTTAQLWWRACKLPMYSVAWVPLACGAALAYCQFGVVNARQIAQLFLGSSLVIAWLNLTNDAFDSTTRVDESKPESVVRLLGGNARLVHAIAWGALAGGAALIGQACVASGSATSWRTLVAAVMPW